MAGQRLALVVANDEYDDPGLRRLNAPAQDADALARQTERTRRFGGERFASTEVDLLGTAIWRLLRQAERAEQPDGENLPMATVSEREVVFEA